MIFLHPECSEGSLPTFIFCRSSTRRRLITTGAPPEFFAAIGSLAALGISEKELVEEMLQHYQQSHSQKHHQSDSNSWLFVHLRDKVRSCHIERDAC